MTGPTFNVGDKVFATVGIEEAKMRVKIFGDKVIPAVFIITDVITQTCHGGTQYKYVLSGISEGRRMHAELMQPELTKFEDFDIEVFAKFADEEKRRRRTEDHEYYKSKMKTPEDMKSTTQRLSEELSSLGANATEVEIPPT